MRRAWAISTIAAALVVGMLLVLRLGVIAPPKAAPVSSQSATGPKQRETPAGTGQPRPSAPAPVQEDLGGTQGELQRSEWAIVERLLAQPQHHPLMREVPRLSAETEARLIGLYRQIHNISDKHHIVRMLAFGGSSPAAATLINAVTNEYSGKRVDLQGHAILTYIPELIGVLARHNQEAFQFLISGSSPEFWSRIQLWKDEYGHSPEIGAMVGQCITGLAWSGRVEGLRLIDWYRAHPEELNVLGADGTTVYRLDGAVVDAAFITSVVRERGLESAMDDVFYNVEEVLLPKFSRWYDSAEGLAWRQWESTARNAAKAKSGEAAKGLSD